MFKKVFLIAACVFSLSFAAGSADKSNAVGGWAQGGNPGEHFGLDYKMRLDPTTALDFYLHFYFANHDNALGAYVGYYWNYYDLINIPADAGRMGLYWGPAGGVGWWDDGIALRIGLVGGWEWEFPQNVPLEFYIELNPVAEWHFVDSGDDVEYKIPDCYLRLGLRFWF